MDVSLVIPCYNEADNLPLLLPRCDEVAQAEGVEVVLVDNGSQDRTPEVFGDLLRNYPGCRSIRVDENRGYGDGILQGLRAAKGQILGWTHADMQTDPKDVLPAMDFFGPAHDANVFVKGRRFGRPLSDVVFTVGMSLFETMLLTSRLWDINAQPTLFNRSFFDSWTSPPNDFSLDLYAYYQARRTGLDVLRFPVHFGERAHGSSHWNVDWSSKAKFVKRTFSYSVRLRRSLRNPSLTQPSSEADAHR